MEEQSNERPRESFDGGEIDPHLAPNASHFNLAIASDASKDRLTIVMGNTRLNLLVPCNNGFVPVADNVDQSNAFETQHLLKIDEALPIAVDVSKNRVLGVSLNGTKKTNS